VSEKDSETVPGERKPNNPQNKKQQIQMRDSDTRVHTDMCDSSGMIFMSGLV
jgi:hypothetical protein